MAPGRLGEGTIKRSHDAPIAPMPASVQCQTCGDAGFVKRDDLAVMHPHFGMAIPCPHCAGARKPRNPRAEYRWFLERDHATRPVLPQAEVEAFSVEPPPDGFAKQGVPVPTTVTEEQRIRAQQVIARNVAAVAAKMRGGER